MFDSVLWGLMAAICKEFNTQNIFFTTSIFLNFCCFTCLYTNKIQRWINRSILFTAQRNLYPKSCILWPMMGKKVPFFFNVDSTIKTLTNKHHKIKCTINRANFDQAWSPIVAVSACDNGPLRLLICHQRAVHERKRS